MPLYEYKCKKGHTFDVMQPFSDEALTKCEICGAPAQRVMHAPAIHFKGSGFYNTDYGTKKRSREMKEHKDKEKSTSDSTSSSSSSDTKSPSTDGKSASSSSSDAGSSSSKPTTATKSKSSD